MNKGTNMEAKHEAQNAPESSFQSAGKAPVELARRRLLRGGVGAVPVILTVSSPSVMATGNWGGGCTPASSFASINASRPDKTYSCQGRTPGYWKQEHHFDEWPKAYVPKGRNATKFNDVFGSRGGFPNKTLLDVLEMGGGGDVAIARHVVAALLNAATGRTSTTVLGVGAVKTLWATYVEKGYYEPTAGIKWYADYSIPAGNGSLSDWLKSTMPV